MKTSTLRKLPLPFVIACLVGTGVLGFLLFSSATEEQEAAQNVASSTPTAAHPSVDSPRYRVKNGVAKLNRSAGAKSRSAKQLTTKKASQQTWSSVASRPQPAIDRSSKTTTAGSSDSTLGTAVATTTPRRQQRDRVKSATLAATSQPTPSDTYSPENPDPSELLARLLDSDAKTEVQLEINEPTTGIAPGIDLTEGDLVTHKTAPVSMAKDTTTKDLGSATKTATAVNTDASSVVNGELVVELDQPSPKKSVRIINPANNTLPVWFITQQRKIQLQPGQRYETSTEQEVLVRFARGGDLGVNRVVTSDGDWVFSVTREQGWQLTQN